MSTDPHDSSTICPKCGVVVEAGPEHLGGCPLRRLNAREVNSFRRRSEGQRMRHAAKERRGVLTSEQTEELRSIIRLQGEVVERIDALCAATGLSRGELLAVEPEARS